MTAGGKLYEQHSALHSQSSQAGSLQRAVDSGLSHHRPANEHHQLPLRAERSHRVLRIWSSKRFW